MKPELKPTIEMCPCSFRGHGIHVAPAWYDEEHDELSWMTIQEAKTHFPEYKDECYER